MQEKNGIFFRYLKFFFLQDKIITSTCGYSIRQLYLDFPQECRFFKLKIEDCKTNLIDVAKSDLSLFFTVFEQFFYCENPKNVNEFFMELVNSQIFVSFGFSNLKKNLNELNFSKFPLNHLQSDYQEKILYNEIEFLFDMVKDSKNVASFSFEVSNFLLRHKTKELNFFTNCWCRFSLIIENLMNAGCLEIITKKHRPITISMMQNLNSQKCDKLLMELKRSLVLILEELLQKSSKMQLILKNQIEILNFHMEICNEKEKIKMRRKWISV